MYIILCSTSCCTDHSLNRVAHQSLLHDLFCSVIYMRWFCYGKFIDRWPALHSLDGSNWQLKRTVQWKNRGVDFVRRALGDFGRRRVVVKLTSPCKQVPFANFQQQILVHMVVCELCIVGVPHNGWAALAEWEIVIRTRLNDLSWILRVEHFLEMARVSRKES